MTQIASFTFVVSLAGATLLAQQQAAPVTPSVQKPGVKAVEKKVHIHDLHATMLYLLGIDHTKLTYHYSGRDFRLTDTEGKVIHDIIA